MVRAELLKYTMLRAFEAATSTLNTVASGIRRKPSDRPIQIRNRNHHPRARTEWQPNRRPRFSSLSLRRTQNPASLRSRSIRLQAPPPASSNHPQEPKLPTLAKSHNSPKKFPPQLRRH